MDNKFPIYVYEKRVNGRIILNPVRMGVLDMWNNGMSGLEAFANAPTMPELMHASATSEEFRRNIYDCLWTAEWTSTFFEERQPNSGEVVPKGYTPATFINIPHNVQYDDKKLKWYTEGGERFDGFLPPQGWYAPQHVHLWCPDSDTPLRTVPTKEEAINALAEIFPYELAQKLVSMLKYEGGFGTAQAYRANGIHPIGAFRFRLFRLGDERNDFAFFKLREIQRETLESIIEQKG